MPHHFHLLTNQHVSSSFVNKGENSRKEIEIIIAARRRNIGRCPSNTSGDISVMLI